MASWMVHLRVADELLEQIENIDEQAFVMGNIAPDSGVPNEDWTVFQPPKEAAEDKYKLVWTAKGDWYDLDFLYLEQHPDFHAFSIYEESVNYENVFMDIFSKDAFENRRQYITGYYRSRNHGDLHRNYKYLTPEQAENFVKRTVEKLLPAIRKVYK